MAGDSDPQFNPGVEAEVPAVFDSKEIKKPGEVIRLGSHEELEQFWTALRRNYGEPDKILESPGEKAQLKEQADRSLKGIERRGADVGYFGVFAEGKMIATGKIDILHDDKAGTSFARQFFLTVHPDYRGKGVGKQLTDAQVKLARESGCNVMKADVLTDNVPGLVVKLRDSFVISGIFTDQGVEKFNVIKQLNEEDNKKDVSEKPVQSQEIPLVDLESIRKLLSEGYVGVNIKKKSSSGSNEADNCLLVFEKR